MVSQSAPGRNIEMQRFAQAGENCWKPKDQARFALHVTLLGCLEISFNCFYIFTQQAEMTPCSGTSHLSLEIFLLSATATSAQVLAGIHSWPTGSCTGKNSLKMTVFSSLLILKVEYYNIRTPTRTEQVHTLLFVRKAQKMRVISKHLESNLFQEHGF